jgi:hypothetical protein
MKILPVSSGHCARASRSVNGRGLMIGEGLATAMTTVQDRQLK